MFVISHTNAEPQEKEHTHPAEAVSSDYRVLSAVLACVLLQPVFDASALPQWLLGVLLIVFSLLAARRLRISPAEVAKQTAWLVLPMGVVLCAAGGLIATSVGGNSVWLLCLMLFVLSATITDIAAAGVAASLVAQGLVPASAALVAVTAGAFATPFGSLSGLLLLQRYAASGVKPDRRIFAAASVCACLAWVAGTLVALH